MRFSPPIVGILALWFALGAWGAALGQSEDSSRPGESWPAPVAENAAAPDVYLLPDAEGKLRQVLGFRYEDFLRAWANRETVAAGPPRFVVERLTATGAVGESQVRWELEFGVKSNVDGWLDIPLELPELVVERVEIESERPGECLVYDAERGGHVAWLECAAHGERKVVVVGTSKIAASAGNSAVELRVPAAVNSTATLSAPGTDIEFSAAPGLDLSTRVAAAQTEATVRGSARPLRLEWRRRAESAGLPTITLESQGEVRVKVGRRRALYTATLQLDSFGKPLELVRLRLPAGVSLTQALAPPELEPTVSEMQDALGAVVEVRLRRPTGTPWALELSAEQSLDEDETESVCQVSGFEVLEAVRQSGRVTLEVDEELQAYFDLTGDLEQTPLPATTGSARTALAAFEYARFPWGLAVHTLPKQRRVNIQPSYLLQLGKDEARMQVEFDYEFTGARTFAVRIDLRGWQLTDDPLESGGAVEASRIVETAEGLLVLPLVNPDAQRARIALAVRRRVELGEQTFDLPEALGGFILPGQLVVESDPALQVTPEAGALEGLGALAAEAEAAGGDGRQVFRTFLARPSLVATLTRRPREVTVSAQSNIAVGERQIAVRQQLNYVVKFQPLAQVELALPADFPAKRTLTAVVDGKATELNVAADVAAEPSAPLVVTLPRPLEGEFQLELRYELPYAGATAEHAADVALPLALPTLPVAGHELTIDAGQPLRVSLAPLARAESWSLRTVETPATSATSTWRATAVGGEATLPLVVQRDSLEDMQNAILERAWLQSWVAGGAVQDRAVFQFRTPHASVHVDLPPALADLPMEVLLDGEAVDFQPAVRGRLSVALAHNSPRTRHVLELRYHRPQQLVSGTTLRTALPKLVSRPMSAPVYWQLVLPRGWHVAQGPPDMTSEAWLGWKSYRWGRQPTRSQSDLEQWIGATSAPSPPQTSSQYLYSAFEAPPTVAVVVTRQLWLVVGTTLVAFGVGMLCVYTPLAERLAFWLSLVLGLLALVFLYPELTLLLGQAILWGGLMTLAVLVLRRALVGRGASDVVFSPASSLVGGSSATESWVRPQRITADERDEPTVAARMEGSQS